MKILTVPQIREADQFTILNEPISSIDLMERASIAVANWVKDNYTTEHEIVVLAGSGNNAGDGLAVARLLSELKYKVTVSLVHGETGSVEFEYNLNRLKDETTVSITSGLLTDFPFKVIFMDAILGSGLSKPIEGVLSSFINIINNTKGVKVAVDISSGLFADKASTNQTIFKADYTLTFQFPKLAFMMPENHEFVGDFHVLDIGLHHEFISKVSTDYSIFKPTVVLQEKLKVSSVAHKGNRGRATIVAGGHGRMGATLLAAKGALHSGIGLLSVQSCPTCINVIHNHIPEALVLKDENEYALGSYLEYENQEVVVMGPAIGLADKTIRLLRELLESYKGQLILDADAITILAEHRELLEILPEGTILTPHLGEFRRLVGDYSNSFDTLMQLSSFCKHHKVVVVLKGMYSAVCNQEGKISFNSTGNQGMAKGGSGDLLCGILAGISPRIKNPFETAQLAVFLHGLAGDISLEQYGDNFMTPSTMISNLKDAFRQLEG